MLSELQQAWMQRHVDTTAKLAAWLSLAALANPELIRRARIELNLGVNTELELRVSPMVSSAGIEGLVLAEEVLPELRQRLLQSGSLEQAWRLVAERHAAIAPALRMEEELTYEALKPGSNAVEAEGKLNRALVSIVRERRIHLAAWAARALPRLPEKLRTLRSAGYLASAVQVNGFRNRPSVAVDGAPPSWMVPQSSSSGREGGVSLSGSLLEISDPRRDGDDFVLLPSDRRIWVSWTGQMGRVTREAVVRSGRLVALEIEGDEVEIATPHLLQRFTRVQAESGSPRMIYLSESASSSFSGEQDLLAFLRFQLSAHGHTISRRRQNPLIAADWDFFLFTPSDWTASIVFDEAGKGTPRFGSKSSKTTKPAVNLNEPQIMGRLLLAPESSSYASVVPQSYSLPTLDFRDRALWDQRVQDLLSVLAALPVIKPGNLIGVPALPPTYERRDDLIESMVSLIVRNPNGLVNFFGRRGSGRTTSAADAVSQLAARRYFTGGIYWLDKPDSWPDPVEQPYLVVTMDPEVSHYSMIVSTAARMGRSQSCVLVLTRESAATELSCEAIDSGVWDREQIYQTFQRSSHADEDTLSSAISRELVWDMSQQMPRGAAHLGRLAGSALRAGLDIHAMVAAVSEVDERLAQVYREAIFELDLLEPLAALPPTWPMPLKPEGTLNAYFAPAFQDRIEEAVRLFRSVFSDGRLPERIADSLRDMAGPTHARIVEFYRALNGGDWAVGPDDGYYFEHFAYHFLCALPSEANELIGNADWLRRADKIAPLWRDDLRMLLVNVTTESKALSPSGSRNMQAARDAFATHGPSCWILIAGTGRYKLPPEVARTSQTIGRELARWGYGMVCGGWEGVDYLAAEAYAEQLTANKIPVNLGLKQIVTEGTEPEFKMGSVERVRGRALNAALVNAAHAVVAIGGLGGTLDICRLASKFGKPVFAIPGTGGDAEQFFHEMGPDAAGKLRSLDMPLNSTATYFEIAKRLIRLLPDALERSLPQTDGGSNDAEERDEPDVMKEVGSGKRTVGKKVFSKTAKKTPKKLAGKEPSSRVAKKASKKTPKKLVGKELSSRVAKKAIKKAPKKMVGREPSSRIAKKAIKKAPKKMAKKK